MNRQITATLVGITVVLSILAEERSYVTPIQDHTIVYANIHTKDGMNALFDVGLTDRLKVESEAGCCFKVRDAQGRIGWIEKTMCRKDTGRKISFEALSVEGGYIDNPTFYDIDGIREMEDAGIKLDRSFKENLLENIDKESIARMSE